MSGAVSWFPGHMHKALKQMHRQLKAIDLVLEVRDARVPFSASNAEFDKLITHKRRIVVLSKSDLADPSFEQVIARRLQGQKQKPFFTSLSDPSSVRKLVGACRSWLKQESSAVSHLLMVVGLPNTGKSSLINAMRRLSPSSEGRLRRQRGGAGAATGPLPGVTRQLSCFKVASSPTLHVMDTPGVMAPSLPDFETALRLGLTAAFKDGAIGEEALLRYLMARLVLAGNPSAALSAPGHVARNVCSVVQEAGEADLVQEAARGGTGGSVRMASSDLLDALFGRMGLGHEHTSSGRNAATKRVLAAFRSGDLGRLTLDAA